MTTEWNAHEPGFDVLHRVAADVYTFVTPFLFADVVPIHNRSLIIRIPPRGAEAEGSLGILNPAALSPEMVRQIEQLERETRSRVRYLISPGDWHYLFIGQHAKAFPEARAYVAPGRVPAQKPDFAYTLLDVEADNPLPELAPHLVCLNFEGLLDFTDPEGKRPRYERVFFHPASRSITSGDVLYYIGKDELHPQAKAMGQRPHVLDFHFLKWRMVRDAAAVQRSFERMLAWDFDRYISIHGDPGNMLGAGAKAQVEALLAWSKEPPAKSG